MLETYWSDLLNPQDPLMGVRQKGWERFERIGLPRPKQEAFQYVQLAKLQFPSLAQRKTTSLEPRSGLVFVDGFFEESLSLISAPLICLPLDKALRSYALFLQNRLTKAMQEESDPFAALNGAFHGRGAFLYIPPKCRAKLNLTQIFTGSELVSPRLHLYLGRNAELELIQSSEGSSALSNGLIDFVLDEGAQLYFEDRHKGQFQTVRGVCKRNSYCKALFLAAATRHSIRVQLAEENAEVALFGLAKLDGETEQHVHVTVEHAAVHTRSKQHFKSVLKDQSRFSFEGKIYVQPVAQKTEAYQLNNNLVLSDQASANAKPNLEIFADDVKASHGATVGQLDAEQLFYLRSRGLSLQEARDWLIEGFCKEILDHAR